MIYVCWVNVEDKEHSGPYFRNSFCPEQAAINALSDFSWDIGYNARLSDGPENYRWKSGKSRGEVTVKPLLELNDHVLREILPKLAGELGYLIDCD